MNNLPHRQDKIKEKRKKTDFRNFLMEITSWGTFVLQKNNGIVSKFPESDRIKSVISAADFEKTRDGLLSKGRDYNFGISFFDNYKKLFLDIDLFNLVDYSGNENSEYGDMVLNSKNVYICVGVIGGCENVLYSLSVKDNSSNVLNSFAVRDNSEIIYSSSSILNSYKIFYSKNINNCSDIYFSTNLNGCKECLFCDNLDNVSYFIKNKQYEKKEYFEKKKEILIHKDKFLNYYKNLSNKGNNINSTDVDGSTILNSENIENGYYVYNMKNSRNVVIVGGISGCENIYDVSWAGSPDAKDIYGALGVNGENVYSSMNCINGSNIYYSYFLESCSYCIGCIGLRNKSYCILNKQYTKQEWEVLADKIFQQMDKDRILGDFFPGSLNPFYFNDTMAGFLGDFTKDEVEKEGYMWRDEEIKVDIPEGSELITIKELNDYQGYDEKGNWKINPEILKKVIKDENGNYYRIVKIEYDFLMKYGLPLPEIHWMDRMKLNFGI